MSRPSLPGLRSAESQAAHRLPLAIVRRRRRLVGFIAAVVVAASLAGCGDDGDDRFQKRKNGSYKRITDLKLALGLEEGHT